MTTQLFPRARPLDHHAPSAEGRLLLVRADASPTMGTGHVMRSLALAQAWIDEGGEVAFACHELPATLRQRLTAEGILLRAMPGPAGGADDAEACLAALHRLGATAIVVDGYMFAAAYQERLRRAGCPMLVVDDDGRHDRYAADIIVNQNLHADAIDYHDRAPAAQLLLGGGYALLRREFRQPPRSPRSFASEAKTLLVVLGGSDPHDAMSEVLEAVLPLSNEGLTITAIIGPANPRGLAIAQRFARSGRALRLLANVADISVPIRAADMVVSSGGTTVWELAYLETPMVVGALVPHEEITGLSMAQAGAALYCGPFDSLDRDRLLQDLWRLAGDPTLRRRLGERAGTIIDGQGAGRVVATLIHALTTRR